MYAADPPTQWMVERAPLSLRWHRAALLGSLWAANEIVFGSFLHNVGFPFTGTLLSSVGVCLMVAGARVWDDLGVLWRAGLVCALMKSISPSAVILGPMIGILLEAWLFWLVLRLFGRHTAACIAGGLLATMTPLLQKIFNILIAFGPDAGRMYAAAYAIVASWFGLHSVSPLGAIAIVTIGSGVPGAVAAGMGIAVARNAATLPVPERQQTTSEMLPTLDRIAAGQHFSLPFLFVHAVLLCTVLIFASQLPLVWQCAAVAAYVLFVFLRYPSLRRRFARPGLWLELGAVAALAGFILGLLGPMGSWLTGLGSGLQMTLRALFVVSAFGGISVELRNPRIVNWFLRRGLGALGSALDAAFRTLPTMVAALGEHRSVLRHPVLALSRMFAVVLREMTMSGGGPHQGPVVYILTGPQGSGKTTMLQSLVPLVRRHGLTAAGIRAPVVMDNGTRAGYNVEDVRTGDMLPLCRLGHVNPAATAGPFGFDPAGLRFGLDALSLDAVAQRDIVLLDEIGPLELEGGGWAPALRTLLESYTGQLVLVIRPGLLNQAVQQWALQPAAVWEPGVTHVSDIAARLAM